MDAITPQNNDTKISNFGLVVCFLGHMLWDNAYTKNFIVKIW